MKFEKFKRRKPQEKPRKEKKNTVKTERNRASNLYLSMLVHYTACLE